MIDTTMTEEVIAAIETGAVDDGIDDIVNAIKSRRGVLNARKLREIKPGDVVVFNDSVRPQYLAGITARVVRRNQKRVVITLQEGVGRYSAGVDITTPVAIVDLVEAE